MGKELGHVEVEVHGRTDRVRVKAGEDRLTGGGHNPPNGDFGADLLSLQ